MTISLPGDHTLEIRTRDDTIEIRLDHGTWQPSRLNLRRTIGRWLDLSAADIPAAWEETTGQRIGHICEGCGVRSIEARVVDGSDEWWCRGCRS